MNKNQIEAMKIFKMYENKEVWEACIGKVIKPMPELTVSILNGQFILTPELLYLNDRLHDDYTREFELEGTIDEIEIETTSLNMTASQHQHKHGTIKGSGKYKAHGTIINTDTLIIGDFVQVIPTQEGQKWFVTSKYRKVKK